MIGTIWSCLWKTVFPECQKVCASYRKKGRYAEIVKTHRTSLPKSNYTPNGIPILVSYCKSSVLSRLLWEWNMERFCFWLHPTLNRVKRPFCSTPVTNRLIKPGCFLPFSLCVPIQLAVGPQSPEMHHCNTSMIITGAIIRNVLSFLLDGSCCLVSEVKGAKWSIIDSARANKKTHHYRIMETARAAVVGCEVIQGNIFRMRKEGKCMVMQCFPVPE